MYRWSCVQLFCTLYNLHYNKTRMLVSSEVRLMGFSWCSCGENPPLEWLLGLRAGSDAASRGFDVLSSGSSIRRLKCAQTHTRLKKKNYVDNLHYMTHTRRVSSSRALLALAVAASPSFCGIHLPRGRLDTRHVSWRRAATRGRRYGVFTRLVPINTFQQSTKHIFYLYGIWINKKRRHARHLVGSRGKCPEQKYDYISDLFWRH